MKYLLLLIFLHYAIASDYNHNFEYFPEINAEIVTQPSPMNEIAQKWKNSEEALKNNMLKFIKMALPAFYRIAVATNISSECSSSLIKFVRGVTKQKVWAMRMIDSAGKLPNGFTSGTSTALGDFETCIETNVSHLNFKGKYCLLDIKLPLPKREFMVPAGNGIPELKTAMKPGSLGAIISKYALYLYVYQARTAVCIPSTCTEEDVKSIALQVIEFGKFEFNADVPYCEVKNDHYTFTTGETAILAMFGTIILLVLIGTIADYITNMKTSQHCENERSILLKCILCFSFSSNLTRLLQNDDRPDSIKIFHGLRVITMLWVILCHTYFTVNPYSHDSMINLPTMAKSFLFQVINSGFLSVETFFFMSSVLVSYVCFSLRERINVPLYFIARYARLTPTLMIVTAFFCVVGQFGSGPLWRETVIDNISNKCKTNGWLNLLYVNNYFYSRDTCMGWTWYISADTQLFLISLFTLAVLQKNLRKGFILIGFIFIFGILSTAFSHIYYNLPPTYLSFYISYDDWYYFGLRGYTPAHFHLSTCCIGLVVGYILSLKQKIHIPKNINMIGWVLSLTSQFAVVFGIYHWNQGNVPCLLVSTLYGSTYRAIWTLALAFITISCTSGHGGIANSILSWEAFVPLGRLTYMVYLLHYGIIYIYSGSVRTTITYNHRTMMLHYFGIVMVTFMISSVMSLFIEAPFQALEKALNVRPQIKLTNGIDKKSIKENA